MNNEKLNDRVFFSAMLPSVCPKVYKGLTDLLDKYSVPYSLLQGTNDIWCRDYMPLQSRITNELIGYNYSPDYLHANPEYEATITDGVDVAKNIGGFHVYKSDVVIDGGNVVFCDDKVVMTAKVFEENPGWSVSALSKWLENMLMAEIVFLPWDTTEKFGHADGICRYAGNGNLIMTNYRQFDADMANRYIKCLNPHFKNVIELHYNSRHLNPSSWSYINFLQTDKLIIVPSLNSEEDEQALNQLEKLIPDYKGRIEMFDAREIVKMGGAFNCCSWTVKSEIC